MSKIKMSRTDLNKLLDVLKSLPEVDQFELHRTEGGIGYTIDMKFSHNINGIPGQVEVEVVGTEEW